MATASMMSKLARMGVIGVVAAAVAQGSGVAAPAYGQQQQQRPGQPFPPLAVNPLDAVQGPVVSLNFPGGTMSEYVAAVQQAAGKDTINVILPADAADLPLPRIALKGVTARTALEALQWAFPLRGGQDLAVRPFGSPDPATPTFAIQYRDARSQVVGPRGGDLTPPTQVEVFSIRELIDPPGGGPEGVPVEAVLTSVEAALGMRDVGVAPELKFHEDSGLLIVRGTGEQIAIVKSLLREIRGDMAGRRAMARQRAEREAERRFNQERLNVEIGLQEQEVRAAKERTARLRQMQQSGQISEEELREAQLEEARQEARMRVLMIERDRPVGAGSGPAPKAEDADGGEAAESLAGLVRSLQARVTALEAELGRSKDKQKRQE